MLTSTPASTSTKRPQGRGTGLDGYEERPQGGTTNACKRPDSARDGQGSPARPSSPREKTLAGPKGARLQHLPRSASASTSTPRPQASRVAHFAQDVVEGRQPADGLVVAVLV